MNRLPATWPKVHVVIPVRDQLHLTQSIIGQLYRQKGWKTCWVFDNGSTDGTTEWLHALQMRQRRYRPVGAAGRRIYEMWDDGVQLARGRGAEIVVVLNNDITLAPRTILRLGTAIIETGAWLAYPDYDMAFVRQGCGVGAERVRTHSDLGYRVTSGTYRHGGMSGYCFAVDVRPGRVDWSPLVDPAFRFWYGDDDLAFTIERRGGKQVRVLGLPVEHFGEATTAVHPEVRVDIPDDARACARKWGR